MKEFVEDLGMGVGAGLVAWLIIFLFARTAVAAPFVTPNMIKRNGLTDEQYELLWRQGKNPKIDTATARDWIFRASRFQNTTNWLAECGKSNDFARLSYKLQAENYDLGETNKIVVASNKVLKAVAKRLEKTEKSAAKAREKNAKNFEKWVKDTQKAKSKSSEEMAEFYDTILELVGE